MSGRIASTAAEWAARLDAGPLDADASARLDAWVRADPRHQGALYRAQAAWLDLDRLASEHVAAERAALAAGREPEAAAPPVAAPTPPRARRARLPAGRLAAGLTAAAVLAGGGAWFLADRPPTYESQVGEMRRLVLADGSVLTLNTDSAVVVRMAKDRRRIALKRGEASFEVAHDASRPFLVTAGDLTVRAVGTAFDVRLRGGRVDVAVTEGVVELSNAGGRAGPPRRLAHGAAAEARDGVVAVSPMPRQVAEQRLAWRDGLLIFQGESLAAAAAEFQRYDGRKVVVVGDALAKRPVFGVFRTNNLDGFAEAAATLGARVEHRDGAVHLVQTTAP